MTDPETAEIGLNRAAEILGVHYMTVYRYVRIGKLPARKVGRDWRVRVGDIQSLLAVPERGAAAPPTDWGQRVYNRMTAFDDRGAWLAVESALVAGLDPVDVYLKVVVPALHQIGRQWESGQLSVAEEHAATIICQRIIARLSFMTRPRGVSKGTVILGCAPGESHALASTIAAGVFSGSGYEVIDCGIDLPVTAFAELIASVSRPVAVGISTTMGGDDESLRDMVAAIREHSPDLTVIVGGRAAVGSHRPAPGGADIVVSTAEDGVRELEARLGSGSPAR